MAFNKKSVLIRTIAVFAALIMAVLSFSSCRKATGALSAKTGELQETQVKFTKNEYHLSDAKNFVFVASSGLIELYFDSASYSVAVKDTNNNMFWYALPEKSENTDKCQASIISVKVSKDNQVYYLNSQDNCVAFDSATFRPVSNGIQITYNMALDKETAQAGFASNEGELYVSVTVIFTLSDGTLNASISCGDIMLSDGYVLETIEMLSFFGAQQDADKNDYIFVPDQSGALIKTGSNDKDEYEIRNYRVYGKDISMGSPDNTDGKGTVEFASALVPAYGIKKGDNAFAAIILSGDTISTISSHRKTGETAFDRVGPSFRITDVTYSGSGNGKTKYVGEAYTGEVNISYRFLTGKSASYVGFASVCREILMREGILPNSDGDLNEHIPFMVSVQGAALKKSAHSYKILSTYEQAYDMLAVMKAKSINSITLRYCGVLDGANNQDILSKASPISALGSKNDFSELKQYVTTQKFDMFLDMSMLSFNGKSSRYQNSAENMAGEAISFDTENGFSEVAGRKSYKTYAVALSQIESNTLKFLNGSKGMRFDGFCINDAGNILYSDYLGEAHSRSNAVNIISSQALVLSSNHKMMVEGGYFYLLKNTDYVTDIAEKTDYPETESYVQIPFVEIVLHGLIDYSLESINLSENPDRAFIKAVEYGAIPSYKWYCSKTDVEKADSVYYYENQIDAAAEKYMLADEALGDLRNGKITAHREVQKGVYSTEYNNSTVIYFNYNDKPVTVNAVKVDANSFIRVN